MFHLLGKSDRKVFIRQVYSLPLDKQFFSRNQYHTQKEEKEDFIVKRKMS